MATRRSARFANPQSAQSHLSQTERSNHEHESVDPLNVGDRHISDAFWDANENEDALNSRLSKLLTSTSLLKFTDGNQRLLFHPLNVGDDVTVCMLKDRIFDEKVNVFLDALKEKYPERTRLADIAKLSVKTMYYTIDPATLEEEAAILNGLREGFVNTWKYHVNRKISIGKMKKGDLQKICQKHGLNIKKKLLNDLKELLYLNTNVNMDVLQVDLHAEHHTVIQPAPTVIQQVQTMEQTPAQASSTRAQPTENDIKKQIQRQRAVIQKQLRCEMMCKLRESIELIKELQESISENKSVFDEDEQLMQVYDTLMENTTKILNNAERELLLYKAVPRRSKSRYVGRPQFIQALDQRVKQYNNEKEKIITRIFEWANQTRSPVILCCASGPSYGITASSQGTIWMSPVMQLTSPPLCMDFVNIWKKVLVEYADKRSDLQENYQFNVLEAKIKSLIKNAEQTDTNIILDKHKVNQLGLGYLISDLNDAGITLEDENNNNDDDDVEMINDDQ